jgi:pyruvate formate lyase activating enzyme
MRDTAATPPQTLLRARRIAHEAGLRHVYSGNVHHEASQSTYCHGCGTRLIGRDWYRITDWALTAEGRCSDCGAACPGRFAGPPGAWGRRRAPLRLGLGA